MRKPLACCLVAALLPFASGCGSGSSSGGGSSAPDFSLYSSTSTLTIGAGANGSFKITLTSLNGFSESATIAITGLPTGATLTPGSGFSLAPDTPQTVQVTLASTVAMGSYQVNITATAGNLSHSRALTLIVQAYVPSDFSLKLNPASLTTLTGTQGSFQLSFVAAGGFAGPVQISISGVPDGITIVPGTSFSLPASYTQNVNLAVASTVAAGPYPLTITGTSGSLTHTATFSLSVTSSNLPSRADFVRTDDSPSAAVYDQVHHRVYVANPTIGAVEIISSTTYQVLRTLPVPEPKSIDISPDCSTVYIGTNTQAVFALDTASMAITARYIVPSGVGYSSFLVTDQMAQSVIAAPDGSALISVGNNLIKWFPAANTATTLTGTGVQFGYGIDFPTTRSGDHTRIIASDFFEPSIVNLYDANADSVVATTTFQGFAYSVAASPDGSHFAVAATTNSGEYIYLLDANLNTVASTPGGGSLLWSTDGKSIYVAAVYGQNPVVITLDSSTLQWIGAAPSYATNIAYFERRDHPLVQSMPLAADETGRIFGSADHGLAIDDATDIRPYTGSEVFPIYDIIVDPDDGPVNETQAVQIETQDYPSVPSIWFGALPATGTTTETVYMSTTAPALNQTGPVNVRIDGNDNVQAWIPQAYTYGAVLSDGPDLAGPAAGSATVHLYGYGLGGYTTAATGVTATMGGSAATITQAAVVPGEMAYPFPLWDLSVQTPNASVGASDISVTTPWGNTTRHSAYHAVDIQTYPLDGSPYSIAFDPTRDRVYVAVLNHIDVFSLSSRSYLSTIQVPTLNNITQIDSVAISPDGKWLAAANWGDGSVAVINPDTPSTAEAIAVGTPPGSWQLGPSQLAATSADQFFVATGGMAGSFQNYIAIKPATASRPQTTSTASSGPQETMWLLDPVAQSATAFSAESAPQPPFLSSSSDGSRLCFSGSYTPLSLYTTATGAIAAEPGMQGPPRCAVNGNYAIGTQYYNLLNVPTIFDPAVEEIGAASVPDYLNASITGTGSLNGAGYLGLAIDPTGAIIYEPVAYGVALFDSHTGQMREFVSLPSALLTLSNGSMVISSDGQGMYFATTGGLTVVQLDSLPLAIGSLINSADSWTVNGTGFVSGTEVSVDGTPVSTTFVSANQIVVSSPPAWTSVHTITLSNPDGHSYTYGAAQAQ